MIGKITKGRGFGGCLGYVAGKEDAEFVGGNLAAGADHKAAAREFQAVASQNQACKKPVAHYSLSAAPGEKLGSEQWRQAAEQHVNNMGHGGAQWVAYRHHDQDHDHIHIIVNRVNPESLKVATDSRDFERVQKSCRRIEKTHGLQAVQGGRERLTEKIKAGQLGSEADSLRDKIRVAKTGSKNFTQLRERLSTQGIKTELNQSKTTGRVSGITYTDSNGERVKGSQLGKEFSSVGIQKGFDQEGGGKKEKVAKARHIDQQQDGEKQNDQQRQHINSGAASDKNFAKGIGKDVQQAAQGKSMPGKDLGLGGLQKVGKILKLGKGWEL